MTARFSVLACLLLLTGFLFISAASADSRIEKIKKISSQYDLERDQVKLSWNKPSYSKKFLISIFTEDNLKIFEKSTGKSEFKLPSSLFTEELKYLINIKALKNGYRKASKTSAKNYVFTTKVQSEELVSDLKTTNSGGRKGQYYLPENYRLKTLPLMIAFHGSLISGSNMINAYKKLARNNDFIILAPDSSNPAGWYVPETFSEPSEDQTHFYHVYDELLKIPHLKIDPEKIIITGTSAGGAMAAFLGTNDLNFTHIAVLHGGVILKDLGANKVPFWLSTGTMDTLRKPSELTGYFNALQLLNFTSVRYTEYNIGHQVPDQEKEALVEWWLSE